MKKNERSYLMFLEDILFSMEKISEYLYGYDFASFQKDHKTVDAVIRNFEIIGEASKKLDRSIRDKYPEVPWEEMYYLRNKVSHEYFGVIMKLSGTLPLIICLKTNFKFRKFSAKKKHLMVKIRIGYNMHEFGAAGAAEVLKNATTVCRQGRNARMRY